jgi:hypothetical protein
MPKKSNRKLFVVIQPLQYLQALELFEENEERFLIVPWANEKNQLHKLVNEEDWDRVIWIEYSGTAVDIVKNSKKIKKMLKDIGLFDEVIISAYYNEFMNLIANHNVGANIVLLEDGNATIAIDSSIHYKNTKFFSKYIFCSLLSFDIRPINNATLFILDRKVKMKIPSIAANVRINEYKKLKSEVSNYFCDGSVYFISSSFINAGMITKKNYIEFLIRLAEKHVGNEFKIILHRFDNKDDFEELDRIQHVEIIESNGPIELYFKEKEIRPLKIISSGSGATETLNLIYGVDVDITMPMIENFNPSCRDNVELLIKHLEKSYSVSFL